LRGKAAGPGNRRPEDTGQNSFPLLGGALPKSAPSATRNEVADAVADGNSDAENDQYCEQDGHGYKEKFGIQSAPKEGSGGSRDHARSMPPLNNGLGLT
jgi:hypothetical protein